MLMTREQAIFFETMDDLDCDGSLEPQEGLIDKKEEDDIDFGI